MNRLLKGTCLATVVTIVLPLLPNQAHAADPTTQDCLTANERSIELRNKRKLREARAQLLTCAAASCPDDVRNECVRRVEEVNSAMPTIVFEVKDVSGADLSSVSVTMDGEVLAERLAGTALSIDPGEHVFVFKSEGLEPVTKRFVIHEGAKARRERVVMGAGGGDAAPVGAAEQAPGSGSSTGASSSSSLSGPPTADSGSDGQTQRILGWTATGLGGVALGLGVVFALNRSSKLNDRDAVCPTQTNCAPGSQEQIDALTDDASSAGTLSAVSFISGALLVGGGLTLVLTAPKKRQSVALVPVVGPQFQGAMVTGYAW